MKDSNKELENVTLSNGKEKVEQNDGQSYYQKSICTILSTVGENYGNILLPEEVNILERIESLPNDPQRLFLRLYLRKPGWFRVEKLLYNDIMDKTKAISTLFNMGLIQDDPKDPREILNVLHLGELGKLAKSLSVKCVGNREEIVEAILATNKSKQRRLYFSPKSSKSMAEEALEHIMEEGGRLSGPIIRLPPTIVEMLRGIIRLFFLDSTLEEDHLSTAILKDLKLITFPPYTIIKSRPLFATRKDWLAYEEALEKEKLLLEILDEDYCSLNDKEVSIREFLITIKKDWQDCMSIEGGGGGGGEGSYFLQRYTAGWVYTRILTSIVGALEKLKAFSDANLILEMLLGQERYCLGYRGRWWERLILNLMVHLGEKSTAQLYLQSALADKHVRTGCRLALERRQCKLNQEPFLLDRPPETIFIYSDPITMEEQRLTGRKLLYLLPGDVLGSVEELALSHFEGEGWIGIHCESGLWKTLWTLCFWDIIYDNVMDVFQTPFQMAPLDLKTDAFYADRHVKIEERLTDIKGGKACELLVESYYPFFGCQALGVEWDNYSLRTLLDVTRSLGGAVLSPVFRLLAEDYGSSATGLPDLLLYKPDQSDYLLVEVKSPNDRLSDAQRNWNAFFQENGINFALCKVLETTRQDSSTKSAKA